MTSNGPQLIQNVATCCQQFCQPSSITSITAISENAQRGVSSTVSCLGAKLRGSAWIIVQISATRLADECYQGHVVDNILTHTAHTDRGFSQTLVAARMDIASAKILEAASTKKELPALSQDLKGISVSLMARLVHLGPLPRGTKL